MRRLFYAAREMQESQPACGRLLLHLVLASPVAGKTQSRSIRIAQRGWNPHRHQGRGDDSSTAMPPMASSSSFPVRDDSDHDGSVTSYSGQAPPAATTFTDELASAKGGHHPLSRVEGLYQLGTTQQRLHGVAALRDQGHEYSHTLNTPPLDHGLSLENRAFAAASEDAYQTGLRALQRDEERGVSPTAGTFYQGNDYDNRSGYNENIDGGSSSDFDGVQAPMGEEGVTRDQAMGAAREAYQQHRQRMDPSYLHTNETAQLSARTERQLLDVLVSPMPLREKRLEVLSLCGSVLESQLCLQPQTVEAVVALLGTTTAADRRAAAKQHQQFLMSGDVGVALGGALGDSSGTSNATAAALTMIPSLNHHLGMMVALYFHLRSTFTAPTPPVVETLMAVVHQNALAVSGMPQGTLAALLEQQQDLFHGGAIPSSSLTGAPPPLSRSSYQTRRARRPLSSPLPDKAAYDLYNLAHRLMMDSDRFTFLPTRRTYTLYFGLCSHFQDMRTAVRRLLDARTQLDLVPSPAMLAAVLRGLTTNGQCNEAVALLSRCSEVEMTLPLYNASLEALLLSDEPRAVFAAYAAIQNVNGRRSREVIPDAETFTLLLLTCEKLDDWSYVRPLLSHMQQYRVRGDSAMLNLMLKGLLMNKLDSYARQLRALMMKRRVAVWPQLEAVLGGPPASSEQLSRGGAEDDDHDDTTTDEGTMTDTLGDATISGSDNTSSNTITQRLRQRATEDLCHVEQPTYEEQLANSLKGAAMATTTAVASSSRGDEDAADDAHDSRDNNSDAESHQHSGSRQAGTSTSSPSAAIASSSALPHSRPPLEGGHVDDSSSHETSMLAQLDHFDEEREESEIGDPFTIGGHFTSGDNSTKSSATNSADGGASDFWDRYAAAFGAAAGATSQHAAPLSQHAHASSSRDSNTLASSATNGHSSSRSRSSSTGRHTPHEKDRATSVNNSINDNDDDDEFLTLRRRSFERLRRRRKYTSPRNDHHLVHLLQQRQGAIIDPEYLYRFLQHHGVPLSHKQATNPAALLRKSLRVVFGVRSPPPAAATRAN